MNILITGASGFIGHSLSMGLGKIHNVYSTDIISKNNDYRFIILDLLKPEDIKKSILDHNIPKIDVIIHCASILATSENHRNIELLYDNLRITESVIKLAKICKPNKILNFSTIGIYKNRDGIINEESEISPASNYEAIYAISKYCSEELFTFLCDNVKVVNLRNAQTIGQGMRKDRIYSVMLDELRRTNTISVWGNGERISAFTSIQYLIEVVINILLKPEMQGTYILGEKNISYLELAKDIIEEYGNDSSKIVLVEKGNRSKSLYDFSKINRYLSDG